MLVDANLLLYASLEDFPKHRAARDWLDTGLNGPRRQRPTLRYADGCEAVGPFALTLDSLAEEEEP